MKSPLGKTSRPRPPGTSLVTTQRECCARSLRKEPSLSSTSSPPMACRPATSMQPAKRKLSARGPLDLGLSLRSSCSTSPPSGRTTRTTTQHGPRRPRNHNAHDRPRTCARCVSTRLLSARYVSRSGIAQMESQGGCIRPRSPGWITAGDGWCLIAQRVDALNGQAAFSHSRNRRTIPHCDMLGAGRAHAAEPWRMPEGASGSDVARAFLLVLLGERERGIDHLRLPGVNRASLVRHPDHPPVASGQPPAPAPRILSQTLPALCPRANYYDHPPTIHDGQFAPFVTSRTDLDHLDA
jgi:hypothetical protein